MATPQSPAKPKAKAKRPAKKSTHPPCSVMVLAAVAGLKDRKGSSLAAIKKYIRANYNCDVDKLNVHIKNAIKSGVEKKTLTQVKGKGASGSFKLGAKTDPEKAKAKKAKTAAKKKAAAEKKKAKREAAKAKKAAKAKAKKEASKAKKSAKKAAKKSSKKAKKPAAKKTAAKKTQETKRNPMKAKQFEMSHGGGEMKTDY